MEEQGGFVIHRDLSFFLLLVPKFTEKVLVSLTRTLFMLWEKASYGIQKYGQQGRARQRWRYSGEGSG